MEVNINTHINNLLLFFHPYLVNNDCMFSQYVMLQKKLVRVSVNILLLQASACIFDFPLSWEEWPQIIVLKGITSCQKSCDRCLTRLQCSVLCHQLAMKSLIHNITAT